MFMNRQISKRPVRRPAPPVRCCKPVFFSGTYLNLRTTRHVPEPAHSDQRTSVQTAGVPLGLNNNHDATCGTPIHFSLGRPIARHHAGPGRANFSGRRRSGSSRSLSLGQPAHCALRAITSCSPVTSRMNSALQSSELRLAQGLRHGLKDRS